MADDELEGITLSVYAYVARESKPVGIRDVERGANLSSPSVAQRHLLKLESLGLLEKNEYGDYLLKQKAPVDGCVWVGKTLVPKLFFYSIFFIGALCTETAIIALSFLVGSVVLETSFFFLTGMTVVSMVILLVEGTKLLRKVQNKNDRSQ